MTDVIMFAVDQLFSRKFWMFTVCSFVIAVMLTFRNSFRQEIYKTAIEWAKRK